MEPCNVETIQVVLAVYDPNGTYSEHAGVVMVSIFEHTKSPVHVHILHDNTLTGLNRSLLAETAEAFAQKIEFHDVSEYIGLLGDETIRAIQKSEWSIGVLFRLAITDIPLPDKAIYLDCDIVVCMDIRELWDISIEDYSCAGALEIPDSRISSTAFGMRIMGCDAGKYINSGVLLMNIPRIKEKLDIRQVSTWFKRYRYCMKYPDQDLINSCFRGDIKILEDRFNNRRACREEVLSSDVRAIGMQCKGGSRTAQPGVINSILHATPQKPWTAPKGSVVDRLYWCAFLKTPWGRLQPEELVNLLINIFQKSPITHRRTAQCYGKIFHRLRKDIFLNDAFKIAALFIKFLFHETKHILTSGIR